MILMDTAPGLLSYRGRRTRQRIPQVNKHDVIVRVSWRSRGRIPWIAEQVGVLHHEIQGAIVRILPECLVETKGTLLDGPVLTIGRLWIAIADESKLVGRVQAHVFSDIIPTVVGVEHGVVQRILEAIGSGRGM